jgi:hypothetical protein
MQRHKMMIWRGGKRAWEWCVQFPRAPPPRRDFSADSRDVSYIFKTTKRSKRSDERKKNIWPVFFFPKCFFDLMEIKAQSRYIWNKAVNRYNAVIGRCRNNN